MVLPSADKATTQPIVKAVTHHFPIVQESFFYFTSIIFLAVVGLTSIGTVFLQHTLAWVPFLAPIWQVVLLPMAWVFFNYPDTALTRPSMFTTSFPGVIYTYFVNKTLYSATVILYPIAFLWWPGFLGFEGITNFIDDSSQITSSQCAMVFTLLWMVLGAVTSFSYVNSFYMWPLQMCIEFVMLLFGYHFKLHMDDKGIVEYG